MPNIPRNAENQNVSIRIMADDATPVEGLEYNTADFSIALKRLSDSSFQALTLVPGTLTQYVSGGFVEETDGDGWYQLGLPNDFIVPGEELRIRVKPPGESFKYGSVYAIGYDGTVAVTVQSGTDKTIVRGDDYNVADGRDLVWTGGTDDQWPDLTGATLVMTANRFGEILQFTPVVTSPTGTQSFRLDLSSTDTDINDGVWNFDIRATLASGREVTLISRARLIVVLSDVELND